MQIAAVLVPIYRGADDELRVVLVRRTERGIHGGQIAFPGGKRIPDDRTLIDTAVRETHEEIGIPVDAVEVLEHLPVMETLTTGFRIYPFLGRIIQPKEWRFEKQEIAEVLEVRIRDIEDPRAHGEARRRFLRHRESEHRGPEHRDPEPVEPQRVRFYRIGPHKLWGATYRILEPLIPRLIAGEWRV